ncbi:hypothetical protein B0H19DRAFT_647565 [Mycena capillaripes]|nr:hypothetical protein B0H19DRAFT_647565 [Mycena capillaripes]
MRPGYSDSTHSPSISRKICSLSQQAGASAHCLLPDRLRCVLVCANAILPIQRNDHREPHPLLPTAGRSYTHSARMGREARFSFRAIPRAKFGIPRNELPAVAGCLPIPSADRLRLTGFSSLLRHHEVCAGLPPPFPTSCSIFTLAGSPFLKRREHASGTPAAFGPVCVSTICRLVGPREASREGRMHAQNMEGLRQGGVRV